VDRNILRYHKTLLLWTADLEIGLSDGKTASLENDSSKSPNIENIKKALLALLTENPNGISLA